MKLLAFSTLTSLTVASVAYASDVDVAVVDVTVPANSVSLAPGGSVPITINMSVTGNQAGTATFEVYRDWSLAGGTFTGSNAEEFTVGPRAGGGLATTFSTSGTVLVAAGQAAGTFTLAVGAFDVTNSNTSGAKLEVGDPSNYQVTVTSPPPPPSDTTPPVISYVLNPASPDSTGWYKTNVALTWTVTENESSTSLVKTGCVDQNITADQTENTYSCSATSDGGSAGPVNVAIKRDATAPSVSVTGVAQGATYTLGSVPTAGCGTADATSGVATAATVTTGGGPVGSLTATCDGAQDNAGNTGSASVTYRVHYDWTGFFQPVDNFALNRAKAGSAIPVKFNLGGNQSLDIFESGYPKSAKIACDTTALTDEIETTVAAGGSSLSYDAAANQYVYVWKTDKAWAGTCRQLQFTLKDGTTHTANFTFTK